MMATGYSGAMSFLTFATALAVAFVTLPDAYEWSRPLVMRHVLSGYGPEVLSWGPTAWKVLLALLIFAAVRAGLQLLFSAVGLGIALAIVSLRQGSKR